MSRSAHNRPGPFALARGAWLCTAACIALSGGAAFAATSPDPTHVSAPAADHAQPTASAEPSYAPSKPVLSLETVMAAREMAEARTTDHTMDRRGRQVALLRITEPGEHTRQSHRGAFPLDEAPVATSPAAPPPSRNPATTLEQTALRALPARNPRARLFSSIARSRMNNQTLLPTRRPAIPFWSGVPDAAVEVIARGRALDITPPHRHPRQAPISLPIRVAALRAALEEVNDAPVALRPGLAASPTADLTASRALPALPTRRPAAALRRSISPAPTASASAQANAIPAAADPARAAYVPWATRLAAAENPRSGPIHHNPHLSSHTVAFTSRHAPGTIVVHVREKKLYLIESPTSARVYPIGTARGALDILGETRITTRRRLPTWTPTPNQRRRDPTLPPRVEAGPLNPLGVRAMGLGWRYRLIHGTADPASIGHASSDGCIRMLNEDVEDLFSRVRVGARVLVLASADARLVEWRPSGYVAYRHERIGKRGARRQVARAATSKRARTKKARRLARKANRRRVAKRTRRANPKAWRKARAFRSTPATLRQPHRKR
ncbi:MAG: L,D-transpeptidase family protein [Pseudomonadota bacterium]